MKEHDNNRDPFDTYRWKNQLEGHDSEMYDREYDTAKYRPLTSKDIEDYQHKLNQEKTEKETSKNTEVSKNIDHKHSNKNSGMFKWLVLAALMGGMIGSLVTGGMRGFTTVNRGGGSTGGTPQPPIEIKTSEDMGQVEAIAAKSLPSVVGITTEETVNTVMGPMAVRGSGSGFIVTEDGYIVSNAHVVGNRGNQVNVLFTDGHEMQGQVVWSDKTLDLGLVKVEDKNLPAIALGDSDNINIGEIAVAIGNPLGLDFQRSVTAGVISGLNRNIGEVQGNYMDGLIQTDASINQGNSGGPLINKRGEVVGINSVKITSGEGLGFAIPINTVKPILEQVIETGDYQSVNLGISGSSVAAVEQYFGNDFGTGGRGVYVEGVVPNSPAANAGIQANDIIIKLGDREMSSMSKLRRDLYNYKVGDTVKVTVLREGEALDLELTFADFEVPQATKGAGPSMMPGHRMRGQ